LADSKKLVAKKANKLNGYKKGKPYKSYVKPNLLRAFRKSGGAIQAACNSVKLSRTTFYNWMKNDPAFAQKIQNIKEELIDDVENALMEAALAGNVTAQIFYLKHNYPERYGDKKGKLPPDKPEYNPELLIKAMDALTMAGKSVPES